MALTFDTGFSQIDEVRGQNLRHTSNFGADHLQAEHDKIILSLSIIHNILSLSITHILPVTMTVKC